jgi:hypothetical protein
MFMPSILYYGVIVVVDVTIVGDFVYCYILRAAADYTFVTPDILFLFVVMPYSLCG